MNEPASEPQGPTQLATVPMHPLTLLQMLIDRGAKADELGKMTDLVERWEKLKAEKAFNMAMNSAQRKMPVVVKDAVGANSKRYAKLENVHRAIKPIYMAEGLSISWGTADSALTGHVRMVADIRHTEGHCEKRQFDIPLDGVGPKGTPIGGMNAPQATGSTFSYGRRYGECLIFDITIADEDNDGAGVDPICNPDQVKVINDLILECEAAGNPVELKRFWGWLGVEGLHALPQSGFVKALNELNRQRKKGKK